MNTKHLDKSLHLQCGKAVDMVIKSSLVRKSLDNVTCLMVAFKNFENCYELLNFDKQKNIDKVPIQVAPQTAKNIKAKAFFANDNITKEKDSRDNRDRIDTQHTNSTKVDRDVKDVHLQLKMEDYKVNNDRYYYEDKHTSFNQKPIAKSVTIDNKKSDPQKKNSNGSNSNNVGLNYTYSTNNPILNTDNNKNDDKHDLRQINNNNINNKYQITPKTSANNYSNKISYGQGITHLNTDPGYSSNNSGGINKDFNTQYNSQYGTQYNNQKQNQYNIGNNKK